jgi:hypothetical protein
LGDTGAAGDDGIANVYKCRGISAISSCDPSAYDHPRTHIPRQVRLAALVGIEGYWPASQAEAHLVEFVGGHALALSLQRRAVSWLLRRRG